MAVSDGYEGSGARKDRSAMKQKEQSNTVEETHRFVFYLYQYSGGLWTGGEWRGLDIVERLGIFLG
jgi:hypothetical protein